MGTSAASSGAGSGVPFDPPWLDDVLPDFPGDGKPPLSEEPNNDEEDNPQPDEKPNHSPAVAPPARFRNARRNLGEFIRTGDREAFRSAIGYYSRSGMGGARRVANRMRVSTKSAANLFHVLQSARDNSDPNISEWVSTLAAQSTSAQDIVNEIIRYVAPNGGSVEENSCRDSMAFALQDLLANNPNIDLLQLGDESIWTLIESFLGYEASSRIYFDNGAYFENKEFSVQTVLRMNEMYDYLRADLSAQIGKLRQTTPNATRKQLQEILQKAVENTFQVYEDSL
jgi:hypothetical protein